MQIEDLRGRQSSWEFAGQHQASEEDERMVPTVALDNAFMAQEGTDTFTIFVARHSKFGFAAATCRESKVPNGRALFFFFAIDMLGLQSSGLEVRQLPRQWSGRGGCSRGAKTVSNSQDRGRNEGRSENPRRSPSAQLTATIRRSGEFKEKNWSRWQAGRSTKHRAEVAKTSYTIWGERVVPESWTRVRAPMRQE